MLHRLSSKNAGAAWVEFLDRYSALIMSTANQFEYEQDRIDECFLYVCEQLNDQHFRRLLKFNTAGKAKFHTWLSAVAFNLCVDWHRKEYGRPTLYPAISALPAFDQLVYRLIIEQGKDKESSFQILRADFPDLTRELVTRSAGRVFSLLTPRQRWQISVRNHGRKSARKDFLHGQTDQLPDTGAGPDSVIQSQQELESLQTALSQLPSDQRLMINLRFQQGLSLKKISEIRHLGGTNRAWRELQTAIDALSQLMHNRKKATDRKK